MNIYESMPDMHDDDVQAIRADQRKVYAGPARYDCPTCGAKNALTAEMKRRGYHCDDCTRNAEFGIDGF